MVTVVGVSVAGAQSVSTSTTNTGSAVSTEARFENLKKLKDLSAEVKAELETARKNKDFEKVKSILTANGIDMPKFEKRLDRKQDRQDRKDDRKERRDDLKNLPDDVKAQLKLAREAGDFDKVKTILEANGVTVPTNFTQRHENRAEFEKLSDDAKAQLKEAFKARDMAKVKSILEANGIKAPAAPVLTPAM